MLLLCNVTCVCVFRTDHLIFNVQLVNGEFLPRKIINSSHSQHPLVPCSFVCRLRPQELCSDHFSMSPGVLLVLVILRQPC